MQSSRRAKSSGATLPGRFSGASPAATTRLEAWTDLTAPVKRLSSAPVSRGRPAAPGASAG